MGKNASGYVCKGHFPRNVLPEKINQEREDQNHPINWGTQTEQKENEEVCLCSISPRFPPVFPLYLPATVR